MIRKIDKKLSVAITLFTIFALIGYFALSFIAQRYIADVTTNNASIQQAPLIFINTVQGYWWFGYFFLLGLLILQWIVKRVIN